MKAQGMSVRIIGRIYMTFTLFLYDKCSIFQEKSTVKTDGLTVKSYPLLIGQPTTGTTLRPQSVHDSGVQPNHNREGNSKDSKPHDIISLGHPLLGPRVNAEVGRDFPIKFLV